MREIKKLLIGVGITAIAVTICIFIYRDDDIDPATMAFPEGMSEEQKVEIVQKRWLKMEKLALDSMGTTNLIKKLVQKEGSSLNSVQQAKLAEKLTSWLYVLKTGKYEDFMAFREPDYWNIGLGAVRFAAQRLHGDRNALDHLPKSEWNKASYEALTTLHFDSIRVDSIHFNVRKWRQRVEKMLKPYQFYPGGSHAYKGNAFNIKTKKPVIGYHVKPIDVMKKHWGIEWARFRAGCDTVGYKGYISAVELALYWSPDEERWLAGECRVSSVPSSYIPEGQWKYPDIDF